MKRSEEEVRPGADFQAGFLFFITIEFSQSEMCIRDRSGSEDYGGVDFRCAVDAGG